MSGPKEARELASGSGEGRRGSVTSVRPAWPLRLAEGSVRQQSRTEPVTV